MRRLLIALTALTLFAAACGDDGSSLLGPGATEAPATTDAPGEDTPTTGATTEPTATTESPGTTGEVGPGGDGDVGALLDLYRTVPLRVTYRFDDGSGDETLLTLSQDPTQDPPVSATLIGENGAEGRFITIGDESIVCDPTSGGMCFEMPDGMNMGEMLMGPMMAGFLFAEGAEAAPGFSVEPGTATIGGRSGVCFTYTPGALVTDPDVEQIRQCIDSELGFILLIEAIEPGSEASNLMELVEFGDPRPEDFEPTGPVTTIPGG